MSLWSENEMLTPALALESIVVTSMIEKEGGTFVKRITSKGRSFLHCLPMRTLQEETSSSPSKSSSESDTGFVPSSFD